MFKDEDLQTALALSRSLTESVKQKRTTKRQRKGVPLSIEHLLISPTERALIFSRRLSQLFKVKILIRSNPICLV